MFNREMTMSDLKSKLPDLKELGEMSSKLFKAISAGVNEIMHDYKEKRSQPDSKTEAKKTASPPKKPVAETKTDSEDPVEKD